MAECHADRDVLEFTDRFDPWQERNTLYRKLHPFGVELDHSIF